MFDDLARQPIGIGGRQGGRAGGAGGTGGVESSDLLDRLEARVDEEVARYVKVKVGVLSCDWSIATTPSLSLSVSVSVFALCARRRRSPPPPPSTTTHHHRPPLPPPIHRTPRYQERVWEEVDPDTADRLREADREVKHREDSLGNMRSQIESGE